MSAHLYPAFLKLSGKRVLLVGGGKVAAGKLEGLLQAQAVVTVVAPQIRPELHRPGVTLIHRPFREEDVEGVWWVVSAAPAEVNRQVAQAAEARQVFVNAVDDPPSGSAYLGGVVRKGGATLAISTEGAAPALAGLLREGLEAMVPEELEQWLAEATALRARWRAAQLPMELRRPELLAALNRLYESKSGDRAQLKETS